MAWAYQSILYCTTGYPIPSRGLAINLVIIVLVIDIFVVWSCLKFTMSRIFGMNAFLNPIYRDGKKGM